MTDHPILTAALSYADQGWPVFPVRGKKPATPNGVKDATTDAARIRDLFQDQRLGVAIATGGALAVIDIDTKSEAVAEEQVIVELHNMGYDIDSTYTVQTPSGGWHLYYSKSPAHRVPNSVGKLWWGVDVRGEGGYVVAPPSPGYQVSSRCPLYPWDARLTDASTTPQPTQAPTTGTVSEGGRNDFLFREAAALRRRGHGGVELAHILQAINEERCAPPLTEEEVVRIALSVERYAPDEAPFTERPASSSADRTEAPRPQIITLKELDEMELAEPSWIVPGLLPEGLSLLSGKPKIGKSWMVLDLAISVASGREFLGYAADEEGDVLYLSLEDNVRRLQKRSRQVRGETEPVSTLHLATEFPRLGKGGEDLLIEWVESASRPRLVIADTFGKVKALAKRDGYDYEEAYQGLEPLKRIADTYGIGVVVIHHNNKSEGSSTGDIFDGVLGSTGLTGSVDATFLLRRKRGDDEALLDRTGRDIENQDQILLRWDALRYRWVGREPVLSVRDLILLHADGKTYAELTDAVNASRPTQAVTKENVTTTSHRLANTGKVNIVKNGRTARVYAMKEAD